MDSAKQRMFRREFLALAAAAAAWVAAQPACVGDEAAEANPVGGTGGGDDAGPEGGFDLPTLGGAPDTPQGRAIAAFVDTVVPGSWRDPDGAPGGIDAGAPALF